MRFGSHEIDITKLATDVFAVLGGRGAGKTNAVGVIAEAAMDAGIQVVILDQVGVWYGLRLKPDGKTPSRFKLPIFGGSHGDIALLPDSGKMVAEALVSSGSSAILDVSLMPSNAARTRFAADFAETVLQVKREKRSRLLLIAEEAQTVIPQVVRMVSPDIMRCLGAFESIANMGRNFGLGLGIISLRPQKVSKEIAYLATKLFAFRMTGPSERETVGKWVKEKGALGRDDVGDELPSLQRGEAMLWAPEDGIYGKIKLPLKSTYDASATPGEGSDNVKTRPLDLAALEATMAKVVAEAKANDPKALKAQVAELQRQLAAKAPPAAKPGKAEVRVEYRTPRDLRRLVDGTLVAASTDMAAAKARLDEAMGKVVASLSDMQRKAKTVMDAFPEMGIAAGARESVGVVQLPRPPVDTPAARATARRLNELRPTMGQVPLPAGERAVLTAIAQHPRGVTREQLTVLTGYKRSTRDLYLQKLKAAGRIEGGDVLEVTAAGRADLGPDFQPLPTGHALRVHWMGRLGAGEAAVLEIVCRAYPEAVHRETISEGTGYKRSTRDLYIQKLAARKLILSNGGPLLTASAELFG